MASNFTSVGPSSLNVLEALGIDVASGLATHLWFNRHEPSSLQHAAIALVTIPSVPAALLSRHFSSTLTAILVAYVVFYASLLTSIMLYRISPFHPLAKYPGPLLCKVSKFWTVWVASSGKLHHYHKRLHDTYGPIVRVGPNELSIVERDLLPSILGPQGMPKGPLWEGRRITPSKHRAGDGLIGSRDLQRHAVLRKPWNKAFAIEPLRDYGELLELRAAQLVEELERSCRTASDGVGYVDIAKWISFFSFDFMGDLAFGGGFELMKEGDKHGYWQNMELGLSTPGLAQHVPWFSRVLRAIPYAGTHMRAFGAFAVAQAKRRASQEMKRKDLFFHLLDGTYSTPPASQFPLIVSNSVTTIVAGSDTTASVMSNIVYYLLSNPDDYARLREEVDAAFPSTLADATRIDVPKLQNMPFLNAVINETLRLQPPVATSLQRAPADGSGGTTIGPHHIPEGTAIQVPPYVIHRDTRYFSPDPDKFWPQRWLQDHASNNTGGGGSPDDTFVLDMAAYIPFSMGPMNCVGKRLAMLELQHVVSMLVMRFDMSFDPVFETAQWEKSLRDSFVMLKGSLPVTLKVR